MLVVDVVVLVVVDVVVLVVVVVGAAVVVLVVVDVVVDVVVLVVDVVVLVVDVVVLVVVDVVVVVGAAVVVLVVVDVVVLVVVSGSSIYRGRGEVTMPQVFLYSSATSSALSTEFQTNAGPKSPSHAYVASALTSYHTPCCNTPAVAALCVALVVACGASTLPLK